ncbi:RidA family protein [Actibacterium sp. 188UL27-1]|uniref:RidA family protein n=1 Tax=Actibacterium sp. 188UL27-1 TaxID=2786961 RepID=UPI00195661DE|nr:RidA family protein [Actibacterium sp. 188UL27-1]MBM7070151.1 RidA family protein [Actibacterium sp. 188UL27-1]
MQERQINPVQGIYAATPDYIHALEVTGARRWLFVSGTMGLAEDGTAPPELSTQLDLVWSNIRRILKEVEMSVDNIVQVTSYLRDAAYVAENQEARVHALGQRRLPTTAIIVETLSEDWKVEIEVIAAG